MHSAHLLGDGQLRAAFKSDRVVDDLPTFNSDL
jgi:hypothetical protein